MHKFKVGDIVNLKYSKETIRTMKVLPITYEIIYVGYLRYHVKNLNRNRIEYLKEENLELFCPKYLKVFL